MTSSLWSRPIHSFKYQSQVDVLIVGAGLAGLSTAYWLSEMDPSLKILIIDRSHLGAGASGRNAGFLTIGSAHFHQKLIERWGKEKAYEIYQFARKSLELMYEHILSKSSDIRFDHASSLTFLRNENQFSFTDDSRYQFKWKKGPELSLALAQKFIGAFEHEGECRIVPTDLLSHLKKTLQKRNIQIIENLSAYELIPDGLKTEEFKIKAKQVVLALNGYFSEFSNQFSSLIYPKRAQMLAVELESELNFTSLCYDPEERVYWRKTDSKTLIIGGKRLLDEKGESGNFEKISPKIQEALEEYLASELKVKFKVIKRWSGIMGFTEDELPILSKVQAPLPTFVIGGFSGHGMGLGFHSGLEMAKLVTGKQGHSFFENFKRFEISL